MIHIQQTVLEMIAHLVNKHPELGPSIRQMVSASTPETVMPKQLSELIGNLDSHYMNSKSNDTSFAHEHTHLRKLTTMLDIGHGFVVDIAASDGVNLSTTLGFFKDPNWRGLAVEMDPVRFAKLAVVYSNFPNARLARGRVTPNNVASLLQGYEVPKDFSLLSLDIDSYDLYVLKEILNAGYHPRIITMEINERIPPPIYFTVEYDDKHFWQGDHFFGCSLAAAADLAKSQGYILESLRYNNAIFIRADVAGKLFSDTSIEKAYAEGYQNKPDRAKLFPWNEHFDQLFSMSSDGALKLLHDAFSKYKGLYTLRPV